MQLLIKRKHVLPRRAAAATHDSAFEFIASVVQQDTPFALGAGGGVAHECERSLLVSISGLQLQGDVVLFEGNQKLRSHDDPEIGKLIHKFE